MARKRRDNRVNLVADTSRVAGGDDFTTKLWSVHERVKAEGYTHVC